MSAPGAMIVNMPVLAASGVAGVTVTVAAGSVSVASARRFRVKYDESLLLSAAAPVAKVGSRTDAMTESCGSVAAAAMGWIARCRAVAIMSTAALVDGGVVPAVDCRRRRGTRLGSDAGAEKEVA